MGGAGNYLTRLVGEDPSNRMARKTSARGTVCYLRRGVRGYSFQRCRMISISENGCLVCGLVPSQVPDFLYLVLDGLPAKFPSTVVVRSDNGLQLRFMTVLPTESVEQIARMNPPLENSANAS